MIENILISADWEEILCQKKSNSAQNSHDTNYQKC